MIYRRKKKLPDGTTVETGPYSDQVLPKRAPDAGKQPERQESKARDLLRQREGDIVKGVPITARVVRVTIDELLKDVQNDYKMNGRRSLRDLLRYCDKYLVPFFGGRRASSITNARCPAVHHKAPKCWRVQW